LIVGKENWKGVTLEEGPTNWFHDSEVIEHKALPIVVSWVYQLWYHGNHGLLEMHDFSRGNTLSTLGILQIKFTYDFIIVPLNNKPQRQIGSLDINKSRAWGFIYGACHGTNAHVVQGVFYYFTGVTKLLSRQVWIEEQVIGMRCKP
jgi:hypothetical protein